MKSYFQLFERGLRFEAYPLTKLLNKGKSIVTTVGSFRDEISDYLGRVKRYTFIFPASEAETTKHWLLRRMSFNFVV